jgi:hypothetical protein
VGDLRPAEEAIANLARGLPTVPREPWLAGQVGSLGPTPEEFARRAAAAARAASRTSVRRRLRLGRVQVYIEPRDAWVGAYVAPHAVYVCFPLPFLVFRWTRRTAAAVSRASVEAHIEQRQREARGG